MRTWRAWFTSLTMVVCGFTFAKPARADAITAAVIYDEGLNGDFRWGLNDVTTQFTLTPGISRILGSVGPFDSFDPLSFIIQPGQRFDALVLVALPERTAISMYTGPSAVSPGDIGSVVAQPSNVGQNLLPLMGIPSPLLEGTYSLRTFSPGFVLQPYALDFVVSQVPEPASVSVLLVSILVLLASRSLSTRRNT